MNKFTINYKLTGIATAVAIFGMIGATTNSWGQQMERKYATRQAYEIGGLGLSSVSNNVQAVDTDPQTAATLTVGLGIGGSTTTMYLDFNPDPNATGTYTDMIPAGTPITIKFIAPAGILNLGAGISIQAITGLSKNASDVEFTHSTVGAAITGASLLGLLSGEGQQEITITPTAAFQGIKIELASGLVGLGMSTDLFGAYIMESATGNINCDDRLDVLYGVTSNDLANLASGLGSVSDPLNTMDGDVNTYAQLNTGAEVLNAVYHTTVFNSTSKQGDLLEMTLQNSVGGLLTVNALTNFQIQLYDRDVLTKTITNDPSLLSLSLLDGTSDIYVLSAVIDDAVFDRAEIIFGGVASALQGLRVYEINRKAAAPTVTTAEEDLYVYAGQSATLSATPGATGDGIAWLDATGTAVSNPYATTTADGGTTITVYASATRSGCNENSDSVSVDIHVIDFDNNTPTDGTLNISYNGSVAITNPSSTPITPIYTYTIASGTLPPGITLDPNTGQLLGTPTQLGTYSFDVTVQDVANMIEVGTFPYVIVIDSPLPIVGASLIATAQKNEVILNWKTETETNNLYFEIERSIDGSTFNKIGQVATQAIEGNSAQQLSYRFVDAAPREGDNYYRFKQIDVDGRHVYSNVAFVAISTDQTVVVYPNPAKDQINISGKDLKEIIIYNLLGQEVLRMPATSKLQKVNVSSLPAGNYLVNLNSASNSQTQNLIISR